MSQFTVTLDDAKHRTLVLNTNLSSDAKFNVTVVYKRSPSGNLINYLVIKSTANPKAFADFEVPADGGIKIPPNVG